MNPKDVKAAGRRTLGCPRRVAPAARARGGACAGPAGQAATFRVRNGGGVAGRRGRRSSDTGGMGCTCIAVCGTSGASGANAAGASSAAPIGCTSAGGSEGGAGVSAGD